jgi:hypothetical protein
MVPDERGSREAGEDNKSDQLRKLKEKNKAVYIRPGK